MKNASFSKTKAIGRAEHLWELFGFSSPEDLVLEDLALALGVVVTEGPLDNMEARLIRQGTKGLIRVKVGLPEAGRKRFAIAHEMGHWELHEGASQLVACTSDDMVASYRASALEAEASHFASGLLMPRFLLKQKARGTTFCLGDLSSLAGYFNTSLTSTALAYLDTSPDDCLAVVVSQRGRIRWWRGTDAFEGRFWLSAGTQLSAETTASDLQSGESRHAAPEEVYTQAWSERGSEPDSGSFVEESMRTAQYDQVFTLLRLP